jgi:hypothetical protein
VRNEVAQNGKCRNFNVCDKHDKELRTHKHFMLFFFALKREPILKANAFSLAGNVEFQACLCETVSNPATPLGRDSFSIS